MLLSRPKLVRNLALAIGIGVGAAALAGGGSEDPVAARIGGTALAAAPARVAEAAEAATRGGEPAARDAGKKARGKRAARRDLPGDAALAGSLDLSRMELVGDHYEVPLDGGRRAVLTLDPTLQQAAEKVLARAKAPRGAVVITATDGRILAYAGRRTEDPKGGKDGIVDLGLVNTAWAPAASVFKLVSASAMIDAGVDPHGKVCYHGGLRSVMASNLEDDKHDNKCADLSYGLAHSQNAIIAKLAHQHLEPARLRETAEALSFGGDLPAWSMGGEAGRSEIPDAKGVEFGKTAAGFTGTYLSPVGGALLANTFATGGEMVTPRLVDAIVDDGGRHDLTAAPSTRVLPAKVARTVAAMMVETCDSGSAAKAFRGKDGLPRSVKVAGKTGTLSRDEPLPLQYSWFVGFAPADDPAISVAVVLGNTDLWWLKAHTAARMLVAEALKPARTAKSGKSGHQ